MIGPRVEMEPLALSLEEVQLMQPIEGRLQQPIRKHGRKKESEPRCYSLIKAMSEL